ncbi:MAG: PepSY-like domain-containing protein [Bacteroidales bacterium]|nr:PepSY-like domain-containing protein [Bacteroidales bacterium]
MKNLLGGMSLACILLMSSCSDEEQVVVENQVLPENVPASVYEDFQKSFPEATDIDWSVVDEYVVATFSATESRSLSKAISVWYWLKDCKKKMQRRDIAFSALPETVKNAFESSEYATWTAAESVSLLTRYVTGAVETIYVLRAKDKSETMQEVVLYYTAEGILVKQTMEVIYDGNYRDVDTDYSDWLPQTPSDNVTAFVNLHYPQAKYLYMYAGREITKVKILDGWVARMLLFDAAGNWMSTHTQLHVNELPANILAAFRASEYANCHIEDAGEYLTAAEGHYYLLTIKDHAGHKQEIRFDENGNADNESNDNTEGDNTEDEPDNNTTPTDPEGDDEGDDNQDTNVSSTFLTKAEIDGYIQQRYPGAIVKDKDYDKNGVEVELSYNGTEIKVQFDLETQGYVWVSSEWDLNYQQESVVPAAIRKTLDSKYAAYRLYFLKYNEKSKGEDYYMAGLKSASLKSHLTVKMNAQGDVLAEYGQH